MTCESNIIIRQLRPVVISVIIDAGNGLFPLHS